MKQLALLLKLNSFADTLTEAALPEGEENSSVCSLLRKGVQGGNLSVKIHGFPFEKLKTKSQNAGSIPVLPVYYSLGGIVNA